MARPFEPTGPGTTPTGPPGMHAGLLGHQVRLPGPAPAARLAVLNGASITNIVVICTSIVPTSGSTLACFPVNRCFGIFSGSGPATTFASTPPRPMISWGAEGGLASVKFPIDMWTIKVAGEANWSGMKVCPFRITQVPLIWNFFALAGAAMARRRTNAVPTTVARPSWRSRFIEYSSTWSRVSRDEPAATRPPALQQAYLPPPGILDLQVSD